MIYVKWPGSKVHILDESRPLYISVWETTPKLGWQALLCGRLSAHESMVREQPGPGPNPCRQCVASAK